MKKKLLLIFTFSIILFVSSSMFGQMRVDLTKTDITSLSPTGSITANIVDELYPPYTYLWSNGEATQTISNLSAGYYSVTVIDSHYNIAYANISIGQCSGREKAIAVQTNASCAGATTGSATVAVKGGSGNYSYKWNTPTVQTTQSVTGLLAGTYTVTVTDNQTQCATSGSVDIILGATTPVGDASVYGNNIWNVYAWNKGVVSRSAWGQDYSGYFTANTLSFNSEDYFEDYDVPSSVTGYQGCRVNGDDHSWSAKRQGFPCGYYKIDIPMHDDWVRLYIDGVLVFGDDNCCESHAKVWEGFLDSNSRVEFQIAEDKGQSRGNIQFTMIQPTAVITNVSCNGESNGAITLPSQTNGTYTYNWGNGITTKDRTGLVAGDYTLTITSPNGCAKTSTYTISQPDPIAIVPSQSNISHIGGRDGYARAVVTGGMGPYSYSWSPSVPIGIGGEAYYLGAGTYTVTVTDANNCTATHSFTIIEPEVLEATLVSQHNIDCNGANTGSITINATGGTAPYSYYWYPSGETGTTASGLYAGTYTVYVYDANYNSITKSFTITEPNLLTATSAAQTNVACHGALTGSATVSANGGIGPYRYSWSPSGGSDATASGLSAGNYTVTVTDDNNCTATQSFIITEPDAIVITPSQTNASCKGTANGSASASVTGGTGSYTYQWSPSGGRNASATGLTAGTYTVTVTDANACTATQSFTITEPDKLVASKGSQTNIVSRGAATGSATVNVTGGTGPYYYSWTPSGGTSATATGLSAGTYTVTVTDDNACTATQSFTITEPDELIASKVSQTNIACHGEATGSATVSVTGGTGSYSYSWSPSGGISATATGLSAGTYTVTVTDANAYTATQSFIITEPSNALTASQGTIVNVNCHGEATGSATVNVTGGTGSYFYSWAPSGGTGATASGLASGTYTVTVIDSNGCATTQGFTINQPASGLSATTASVGVSCFGGGNGSASVSVSGGSPNYSYSWSPSGGTSATAIGLSAGDYTCTITDSKGCTLTKTVTVATPAKISGTITKVDVSCNGGTNGLATVTASGGAGSYSYSWSPTGGNAATASGLSKGNYTVTIQDGNACVYIASVTIDEPSVLTASISHTDALCNGGATGTATVVPSGGTGTYSYLWSPSGGTAATATGLATGTYNCKITDSNGCFVTRSIRIDEPTVLSATTSQRDATCMSGGQAAVNVSGGVGPYTYLWSPSGQTTAIVTGLNNGSHSCLIADSNGCTITKTFLINTTNTLIATTSKNDILCNGTNTGFASVVPSGAPGPFTYVWAPTGGSSNTASNLAAGNYSVTITSANGCSIVKNFTITEPSALTVTPSQTNLLCNGVNTGSASVSVSGGTGSYTYAWSPSGGSSATATGLSSGTYTVIVTDANSCTSTQRFTITEPNVLTATAVSQTNIACHGANTGSATVGVSGGKSGYSYSWAPSGGNSATATGLSAGTYTVTVTDANSCTAIQSFTITEPALLEAVTSKTDITCYSGNDGTASVNVSGGKGAYTYLWSPKGGNEATASGLTAGTYFVTITDANSCSISKTVVIEEPAPFVANTLAATNITVSGAVISGTISSENNDGKCLTETGFVYSLKSNPLLTDNKIIVGRSLGSITSTLTNLKGNAIYYVKAYTINSNGFVAYGNEVSFTTDKYTLTITASAEQQKVFGTTDPVFKYTVSGLANGDTNAIIRGNLSREVGENVGKYKINAGTIDAGNNYKIVFESAVFEITKADQVITWNQDLEFGCETENNIDLNAVSNSGLSITYSVVNSNIAEVLGNNLAIKNSGSTSITASQIGDQNHHPAVAVIKPIEVTQSGLITQHWSDVLFFDNKNKDFVSWQWYKNGTAISGATRQYFNENQALNGTYYVIATDKDGNKIKSCLFEITGKVFSNNIKIYPNPVKASTEFTLECNFKEAQLKGATIDIFDINGKLIQTVSNIKTQNQIIAPSQTAIYVVLLTLSNGEKKTINVLVK
ncbi:MBG domain-containing protein [Flavobacterium sp. 3-210]